VSFLELSDRERLGALLAQDPLALLEALDESVLGVDGLVTAFTEEGSPDFAVVRWAQGSLGLRGVLRIVARTVGGLDPLLRAIPRDRSEYDAEFPFWAAGALGASFSVEGLGAGAIYRLPASGLRPSPVVAQCERVRDLAPLRAMFRKLADDLPAYALSLRGELAAVAVVTHHREQLARVAVYTVEERRRRGFGRGVLSALAEELLALGITPTAAIDLGHEAAVRAAEGAGFVQADTFLRARIGRPRPGGLVQLPR